MTIDVGALGPVQIAVFSFPGSRFDGRIAPELEADRYVFEAFDGEMSDFLDDDQLQALASDLIVTSPSLPAPARVVAASDADGPVADFTPVG